MPNPIRIACSGVGKVVRGSTLIVAAILFCLGLVSVAARRNAIGILIGIELIINAAILNFVAFWRFSGAPTTGGNAYDGPIFGIFPSGPLLNFRSSTIAKSIPPTRRFV